ncbi:hypothetical protein CF132_05120 [Aeromonas dhakensis]|nr:hypothetical protein CF132_05120 [Aeromonas dhakensis]
MGILLNNLEMKRLQVQTGGISVMRRPSSEDGGKQIKGMMTGDSVRCGTGHGKKSGQPWARWV